MINTKKCNVCKLEKNKEEFYKYKISADGYAYECKKCQYSAWMKRYSKNPEYQKKHNEYRRKWRKENREKDLATNAAWREKNRQKIRDYNSSEKTLEKKRQYMAKRRREDAAYRIRSVISRSINLSLRKVNSSKKGGSTFKSLGYSPEQLKLHLESQFDQNMTWENYGSYWHIDHIIPHSHFHYDSLEHPDFKKCWALENLRPLEAKENIRKGNKLTQESIDLLSVLDINNNENSTNIHSTTE